MKSFKLIFLALILVCSLLTSLSAQTTIAVFNFENNSLFNRDVYEPLTNGLSQIMISELSQINSLQLVERENLNDILDEIKLSQSGVTMSGKSAEAGKLAGAQFMVFGSYIVNPKEEMRIDVRIIHVETGMTVKAAEVTGKGPKFLPLIQQLSEKIVTALAVEFTKTERKKLKSNQKMNVSALLNYSRGISCEDKGEWDKSAEFFKKALREEPEFNHVKERVLKNRHNYSQK